MRRATRTAAKRGRKVPSRPWRHPISFQAATTTSRGPCLTEMGGWSAWRCRRLAGAPRPGWRAGAGKGCCPGSLTVALDSMPTTYCSPSGVRFVTKWCALPITRIRPYHSHRNLPLDRLPNLLQCNLWLALKPLFRDATLGSQRAASWHHASGRYNRHAIGKLEFHVLTDQPPPPGSSPIGPTPRSPAGQPPPHASPASEKPCRR